MSVRSQAGDAVVETMRLVRAEVARRRGTLDAGDGLAGVDPPLGAAEWAPIASAFVVRQEYALPDLLDAADATFVTQAYRAVLRRDPDPDGLSHFLGLLRGRRASKVEILGMLRWSPEGVAKGVHIDGLLLPFTVRTWMRKRFVGPLVSWLHGLLHLGRFQRRQEEMQILHAWEDHSLGRSLNVSVARIREQMAVDLSVATEQNWNLIERSEDAVQRCASLEAKLSSLDARLVTIEIASDANRTEVAARLDETQTTLEADRAEVARQLASMQLAFDAARAEARKLEQREAEELRKAADRSAALDPLYAAFEDKFRGERALVRARVEPFVQWIREASAGSAEAPVLDLGCGRGEWLELLRDHGMHARGVDLNRVFVEMCTGRGLDVAHGDVIEELSALGDGSIGAVTSMHLVEHLPFETVIQLLDEIRRVLRPGGIVLLETPNPENLSVGSFTFYMDPTHRNPLPPEALRWIVEARGFMSARIERLSHARDLGAPPLVDPDIPGGTSMNVLLASLNAAPDYAIVASRP